MVRRWLARGTRYLLTGLVLLWMALGLLLALVLAAATGIWRRWRDQRQAAPGPLLLPAPCPGPREDGGR